MKTRRKVTRTQYLLAILMAVFVVASYLPLPGDEPDLMPPVGWGPNKFCFRWSPDECYIHWVAPGAQDQTAPPPEAPLCKYGRANNSPRCDVRFSRPQ